MLRLQGSWSSFSRLGFRLYGIRFMVYGSLGVALGFPAYGLRFSSPAVDQGELAGRHAGLAAGDAKRMSEMQKISLLACVRPTCQKAGRDAGVAARDAKKKSLPRTGTAKHDLVLPGTITYYYNRHPCMPTLSSFHYSTILQIYCFTISLHIVLP